MKIFFHFLILLHSLLVISCGGDTGKNKQLNSGLDIPLDPIFWGSCKSENLILEKSGGFSPTSIVLDVFEAADDDQDTDDDDLISSKKTCREWYGEFFLSVNLPLTCQSLGNGIMKSEYCDQREILGMCIINLEQESQTRIYYHPYHWSSEEAELHCSKRTPNGTWIPK